MPTTRGPYLDGASFSVKEVRKGYDRHAQSPVYPSSQDERRVDCVDSAQRECQRADGAQVPEGRGPVTHAAGRAETRGVGHRPLRAGDSGSGSRRIVVRGGRQRHTATRIWERLRDEYGAEVSLSTVTRKVAQLRRGSARGTRGRLSRSGVASRRGTGRFRAGSTSGIGVRCLACAGSCWISRIRTSGRRS